MQGFSYLLLSKAQASLGSWWMQNLKWAMPVFFTTTLRVFLVPMIMAPQSVGEAGTMLYLLYSASADTLTGMLATAGRPRPGLASATCVHRKGGQQ